MPDKGKVLGIDYGDAKIGVAISDESQTVAFGRVLIKNKSRESVIKQIKEICDSEKVVEIVIGLPLNMDGEETAQTRKVEQFGDVLESQIGLPVNYNDERLTSAESDAILYTLGVKGSGKSKKNVKKQEQDIIAASLILQNYLNLLTGKQGK
ncbi:Holliday junction resolvase RuvX [Patescibacteria group bacterium]